MRTAMPKVTCGRITERGPSATRGIDLDAAVHRPGVHDDRVAFRRRQLVLGEPVVLEELLRRGQQRAAHALVLQPQHHHHVAVLEPGAHVVEHAHAERLHPRRKQRLRTDHAHLGHAEDGEAVDQRARHARVQDIAHHRHREASEVLLVVPDGVEVEQALRRVRVPAVARVDHVLVRLYVPRDEKRRPRGRVAHDEDVGVHRRQVGHRVEQRFALRRRRYGDVQVDDVGGKTLRGDLEGGAGARRGLEKEVEHALAAQERHLLHFALRHADEGVGGVEDLQQHLARQPLDRQEVLQLAVRVELGITLHGRARARAQACPRRHASGAGACPRARRCARRNAGRR